MLKKSRALVLIAHGSRLEAANEEIRALASRLEARLGYPVIGAFLELAAPSIPEAVDLALATRAAEILILPYFLTQGRHVQADIPAILAEKARAYPETPLKLLPYLGSQEGILSLLEILLEEPRSS
ncbi:MAG TPA: CbiX/SirB N-terminal domain-containing protein [bacterium]|nr:CbiX/SirB N-terminal domain-containing protein [bacterium]